jgi:TRAP-type C4-dicarboxylate transport system permease large subunit
MTLGIRKLLVIAIIGGVFLTANIMIVAAWLQEHGVIDTARDIRQEFLTGTAITVIIALLILLVGPTARGIASRHRCPVCDHGLPGSAKYCGECGSKV